MKKNFALCAESGQNRHIYLLKRPGERSHAGSVIVGWRRHDIVGGGSSFEEVLCDETLKILSRLHHR